MRVLVSFKVVADLAILTDREWRADEQLNIDVSYVRTMINCFDESAAELALMLRDEAAVRGTPLALTAFTLSDRRAESALRQLCALEYSRAIRIEPPSQVDLRFNPLAIAKVIAAYHQQIEEQSLILLGMQSGEGHNMQTAMLLAELLHWPCITEVTRIEASDFPQQVVVTRQTEDSEQRLTIRTPAILAVGNAPRASVLRVPTLKQKLVGGKRMIGCYSLTELGLDPAELREEGDKSLLNLERQRSQRAALRIDGDSAAEKAQQLYQRYLKPRMIQ